MQIQQNVELAQYSTMRLGGNAKFLVVVDSEDDLVEAVSYAEKEGLRIHVVGEGSNSIFSSDGFDGLVIINRIRGIEENTAGDELELVVGAGEKWDDIVKRSVDDGYFDIAAMSLVPGTMGAAPIQNIGAYGQQVSDSIAYIRALEVESGEFVTISKEECSFTYRASRFNGVDKGKFIITSVKMRLCRKNIEPPFYADVSAYFTQHGISETDITAKQLREAVSTVRVIKLPDPSTVASCGSFFKNPVVSVEKFNQLQAEFPELKAHKTDDGKLKLYGGQLIEMVGMKGYHDDATGMGTWKNHALVLINETAKNTGDLLHFKTKIADAVKEKFGIELVQEPELIS